LRDYLVAAYALGASNVSPTQNEAYAILDAGELFEPNDPDADYPPLNVEDELDLDPDGVDDPFSAELTPYQGEAFEIALPPATASVTLDVERHYLGLPGQFGPDLRFAALPMAADDSIVIEPDFMGRVGGDPFTLPVNGRDRLALVLVAGQDYVDYTVSATASIGQVGLTFSHPTSGNPHCNRIGLIRIDLGLTVDGAPVIGETAAGLDLKVDGQAVEDTTLHPMLGGGYRLFGWAPDGIGDGEYPLSVTYAGETFAVPGGLRIDPSCPAYEESVEIVHVPSLAEAETELAEATIAAGAASATFFAEWLGSDVDLTLTSPSGRVIDESNTEGDVSVIHTADDVTITVTDPEAGAWDIALFGDDLPDPEPVDLTVTQTDAPLLGDAILNAGATAGLPLDVAIALSAPEALSVASVTATVTDPVGAVRHHPLYDDGGHRDGGAGDGLHAARVFGTDLAGTYRIELRAIGTDAAGAPFSRVAIEEVTLGAMVDADADGVADGAEFDLGLDENDPADAAADADADGLSIAAELVIGTDPFRADTDAGGEHDGSEAAASRNALDTDDDTALPSVTLAASPTDGGEVVIDARTADDGSEIRLYRAADSTWTLVGTFEGPSLSMVDGPLDPGEYTYAASVVGAGGAESPRGLLGAIAVADDVTPPDVRLLANGGVWESGDTTALLRFIDLTEPVADMRLALSAEDLALEDWRPFEATPSTDIEPVLGFHTVYAQVRDAAGNASRVVQAPMIFVDDQAPHSEACCLEDEYEIAPTEIPFDASDPDALSEITSVELWWRQRPDEQSAWTAWTLGTNVSSTDDPLGFTFPAGAGEYEFYTVATDAVGNREAAPSGADSASLAVAPIARTTLRGSVSSAGGEANAASQAPALSADGRFVAFASAASNLVTGDTNGVSDVFVHDAELETTSRVSVDSAGAAANGASVDPGISADGRFVVFSSTASNLVAGDSNAVADVFVHDRQSGSTTRLSLSTGGAQGDGASEQPAISADGGTVAFRSAATNLVGSDTNAVADVFVHDLSEGTTGRVSLDSAGGQADAASAAPAISEDGSTVAFDSAASNLVSGDTNGVRDVFVHDGVTGATDRISVAWDGTQGDAHSTDPAVAADGRLIAFASAATTFDATDANGFADIYAHHRDWVDTWRITVDLDFSDADAASSLPSVSADGRYVAFVSSAADVVADDSNTTADAFIHDLERGRTARWSLTSADAESAGIVTGASISADGEVVAFVSDAADLVSGDTNAVTDVFIRGPE
jgi:Tol biopolymer transport system component